MMPGANACKILQTTNFLVNSEEDESLTEVIIQCSREEATEA